MDRRAQRVDQVVQQFRRELVSRLPEVVPLLARAGATTELELLELLLGMDGPGVVTSAKVAQLREQIQRIMIRSQYRAYAASAPVTHLWRVAALRQRFVLSAASGLAIPESVGELSLPESELPETLEAEIWIRDPNDPVFSRAGEQRARQIYAMTQRQLSQHEILSVADPYRQIWARSFNQNWETIGDRMATVMEEAARQGRTSKSVIRELVDTGIGDLRVVARVRGGEIEEAGNDKRFVIRGHFSEEAWARGFARAKFTGFTTHMGVRNAIEAGLTHFVNQGVPDHVQSDECYLASNAGPMTLQEWGASEPGPPPRHVFHCRCGFIGVPAEMIASDWSQPNPDVEERMRQAAEELERLKGAA